MDNYAVADPLNDKIQVYLSIFSDQGVYENIWRLQDLTVDFDMLDILSNDAEKKQWMFSSGCKDIVKAVCIELSKNNLKSNHVKLCFDVIFFAILFIKKNRLTNITPENFPKFIEYYCLNTIQKSEILPRRTPRCGSLTFNAMSILLRGNFVLSTFGVSGLVDFIPYHHLDRHLEQAIDSMTSGELTYADWQAGGSFNFLDLDFGKYYVEYCHSFFSKHYVVAAALNQITKNRDSYLRSVGMKSYSSTKSLFNNLLSGAKFETASLLKNYSKETCRKLLDLIQKEYREIVTPMLKTSHLMSAQAIKNIMHKLGINEIDEMKNEYFNALSYIISLSVAGNHNELIRMKFSECFPDIKFDDFIQLLNEVEIPLEDTELPNSEYYMDLGMTRSKAEKNFCGTFVRKVRSAGLTCIVAYTGWRGSEFAFPLDAITVSKNLDIVDSKEHPFRINVRWHVFKTNGDTLADREINLNIYQLALKLMTIKVSPIESTPCLFDRAPKAKKLDDSYLSITAAVSNNWSDFVSRHEGFILLDDIDEYDKLQEKIRITELNTHELQRLSELQIRLADQNIEVVRKDFHLRNSRNIARSELSRVLLFQTKYGKTRTLIIKEYHKYLNEADYDLPLDFINAFDTYLSSDSIESIKSAGADTLNNPILSRNIFGELVEGCMYPTPHAFRHMWVEAVYRRYDGDVGWLVRSNFQHTSRAMWLSYFSGKNQVRDQENVKTRVASSLLQNWLRSEGDGYAGKMHKFLKRLFGNTEIIQTEKLSNFIEQYAAIEVDSIKANPWGFCISRRRTNSQAQCWKYDSLNQQNAAPELCLKCVNNLSNQSNLDYLIFSSYTHLDLLEFDRPNLIPASFRAQSARYLNSARKILEQLEPTHEMVTRIRNAIALEGHSHGLF